jgi:hypothetical protein
VWRVAEDDPDSDLDADESGLLSGERDGHPDRPGQTTYQFWLSPPEV